MARQLIVAGNWKMNGNNANNLRLLQAIDDSLRDSKSIKVLVFPPFIYLKDVANFISQNQSTIELGAQTLSEQDNGAFTGEVSANMLKDNDCQYVLVGHSERRSLFQESNELVANKFAKAIDNGITPVLCLGESLAERDAGKTMDIVLAQLDAVLTVVGVEGLSKSIIAYEPVWAIGTGKTASPEQAQDVHHEIRCHLNEINESMAAKIQILYGGSVNATNATELFAMADIDGGLIGGASLKAEEFSRICVAAGN